MRKFYFLTALAVLTALSSFAQVNTLSESFDAATPSGWTTVNNSNPVGASVWTSGANPSGLPGFQGAGCAVVNFNSTTGSGDISNWYLSPEVNLKDGATISFYTRTSTGAPYADRLEVRLSTSGSSANVGSTSTSVGDFTIVACTINPTLQTGAGTGCGDKYPDTWTQITLTVSGVGSTPVAGRIAFRYTVTNGGPSGTNSNIIGLDDFNYSVGAVCGTPLSVNATNITNSSATINWSAATLGSPVNYELYYATAATPAPDASTTPSATGLSGTSTSISSLTSNQTYYVWMRTNCGSLKSNWTSAISFTTLCSATSTYPYTITTTGVTPPALPSCTQALNVNGDGSIWKTANYSGFPPEITMPVLVYTYSSVNAANDWLFTRGLTLTGGTSYTLTFKYGNDFSVSTDAPSYYPEKMKVMYGSSATAGGMTNLLADYPTVSSATPLSATLSFTPATTGTYYIGFQAYSDADQDILWLSDVSLNTTVPAPVALGYFTGKIEGPKNILSWATASESNNKGFELERSADGRTFSKITFFASKADNGNSNAQLSYTFTDEKPLSGTNYYRLKQVDKDGKFMYSDVVVLKNRVTDFKITNLYPNPARTEVKMIVTATNAGRATIIVSDLTGKVISQVPVQLAIGENNKTIKVQSLANGTYMIKVIGESGLETAVQRFVKN